MSGPNDGGIKRGDRAETGDDEAGFTDGVGRHGSGVAGGDGGSNGNVTATTDSLAEPVDGTFVDSSDALIAAEELEDFEIKDASDPSLGLTNVPNHPAEDWAADTGPARDEEEVNEVAQPRDPKFGPRKRK